MAEALFFLAKVQSPKSKAPLEPPRNSFYVSRHEAARGLRHRWSARRRCRLSELGTQRVEHRAQPRQQGARAEAVRFRDLRLPEGGRSLSRQPPRLVRHGPRAAR